MRHLKNQYFVMLSEAERSRNMFYELKKTFDPDFNRVRNLYFRLDFSVASLRRNDFS
jgi:hypothetical protein